MSVRVRIPSPLRSYTQGADVVETEGGSVGEVLASLGSKAAGIEARLFKGPGQLHRYVNVYVNDEDIRSLQDLRTPVSSGDEISIVPAIAGGLGAERGRLSIVASSSRVRATSSGPAGWTDEGYLR